MQTLIPVTKREYLQWTLDQELKKTAERDGFLLVDVNEPKPKPTLTVVQFQRREESKNE
jgi:hypothetical protein